jgi:hypothetical protein
MKEQTGECTLELHDFSQYSKDFKDKVGKGAYLR